MITFIVPGEPVAWKRPARKGRQTYTDPKCGAHKRAVKWRAKEVGVPRLLGPIGVELVFTYQPPKSWLKKDRERAIFMGSPKVTTPDLDNLEKQIMDALNGVAYKDDAQVALVSACKVYGDRSQTKITLYSIFGSDPAADEIPGKTGTTQEAAALV